MRTIVIIARFVSALFRPTYYPLVCCILLFTLTYLSMLPWQFKAWMLAVIYLLTVGIPALLLQLYRSSRGIKKLHLRHQHLRHIPFSVHLLSSLVCYVLLKQYHMPSFVCGVLLVDILIQASCLLINFWTKISMHSAGSGGLIGGLLVYSALFGFNPLWWLCGGILLSGFVMTSRMLLRQNSLWQVLGGTLVGVACGYVGIMFG